MLCHWLMILLMNFWFWLPLTRASTIKRRLCDLPWLKSVVFPLFNRCYFKCMHFVFISSYLIASFRSAVLAFLCTSHIANMLKGCEWKSKRKTMILFILTGYRLDWKCNSKHRIISGKIGKRQKERANVACIRIVHRTKSSPRCEPVSSMHRVCEHQMNGMHRAHTSAYRFDVIEIHDQPKMQNADIVWCV